MALRPWNFSISGCSSTIAFRYSELALPNAAAPKQVRRREPSAELKASSMVVIKLFDEDGKSRSAKWHRAVLLEPITEGQYAKGGHVCWSVEWVDDALEPPGVFYPWSAPDGEPDEWRPFSEWKKEQQQGKESGPGGKRRKL